MPRFGVTFEQVELAAENLLAQGENPTIERVRQLVGGTGSNSTLAKHLHDWRAQRLVASTATLPAPHLPPDAVHTAVNRVWQEMQQQSASEIQNIRTQYEAKMTISQQQLALAQESINQLTQERDALIQGNHQLTANQELLTLDLKAEQQQRLLLETRYQANLQQYQTLEQLSTDQLQELQQVHEQTLYLAKEHNATLTRTYHQQLDELKTQYETMRQQQICDIDVLKTEKNKQEKKLTQLTTELQTVILQLTQLRTQFDHVSQEKQQLLKQIEQQAHQHLEQTQWLQLNTQLLSTLEQNHLNHANESEQIQSQLQHLSQYLLQFTDDLKSISMQLKQSSALTADSYE